MGLGTPWIYTVSIVVNPLTLKDIYIYIQAERFMTKTDVRLSQRLCPETAAVGASIEPRWQQYARDDIDDE